jgi:predicted GNAT family N-acyltransferase
MKLILYKRASTLDELEQIRTLQLQNSTQNITSEEQLQEGFVTVQHTIELLEKMNLACAHIIAKQEDVVVGYALVMLPSFRKEIAVLIPMFERIDALLLGTNYVVMGQICIAKESRKQGIFRGLYDFYKTELQEQFDVLVTEVAAANLRSIQAHEAVGFKTIEQYNEDGVLWNVILWDWK